MIVLDNGDAIRGIAEVASKLDFTVNGYVGDTATQLADGQMANSETDMHLSGADATVATSITVVNTDSAARTFTLYLKPSGGTSRAISPVSLDLPIGYSFYTDGQRVVVMSLNGEVVSSYSLHAPSHTDGTDDIQDATAAQKGVATAAQITKLDAIASGADVTGDNAPQAHKDSHDPNDGGDALDTAAPNALLEVQAQAVGTSHSLARADHDHAIVHDITDNSIVTIDGSPNSGEWGIFTADGIDGKTDTELTAALDAATDALQGAIELATLAEVNTGTDTGRAVTPDTLAGSIHGQKTVSIKVFDDATAVTTGNGKVHFFVPASLTGMNLVAVSAGVSTVSSSGLPTIQIHNLTDTSDMLTTEITIDENEKHSKDATDPPLIDTNEDDVVTGDELRIDVDIAGTGTKGLQVDMIFQLP